MSEVYIVATEYANYIGEATFGEGGSEGAGPDLWLTRAALVMMGKPEALGLQIALRPVALFSDQPWDVRIHFKVENVLAYYRPAAQLETAWRQASSSVQLLRFTA